MPQERKLLMPPAISSVLAPLSSLLAVIGVLAIIAHQQQFLSRQNWISIVQSTAVVAVLAVGETAVIIAGEIDLSVGRVMAFSAVLAASAMVNHHQGVIAGILICCTAGAAAGLVNGLLCTFGRMPSFIASLGMMGVAYGLALMVSGDANISGLARGFDYLSKGDFPSSAHIQGLPVPLILMAVAALCVHVVLSRTGWGRRVYAVGGNRDAARLSGISLPAMRISVFVISGLLAGFAACLHMARTGGAQPTAGEGMELQAIAATVIGGTSLMGGLGGIPGTLIGAFLIAVIQNGCDLKGIEPHFQVIIIGMVIWIAAMYDGYRRRGTR